MSASREVLLQSSVPVLEVGVHHLREEGIDPRDGEPQMQSHVVTHTGAAGDGS
jgi:hypothetical protein